MEWWIGECISASLSACAIVCMSLRLFAFIWTPFFPWISLLSHLCCWWTQCCALSMSSKLPASTQPLLPVLHCEIWASTCSCWSMCLWIDPLRCALALSSWGRVDVSLSHRAVHRTGDTFWTIRLHPVLPVAIAVFSFPAPRHLDYCSITQLPSPWMAMFPPNHKNKHSFDTSQACLP